MTKQILLMPLVVAGALWAHPLVQAADAGGQELISGKARLTASAGTLSLALSPQPGRTFAFNTTEPLAVEVLGLSNAVKWVAGGYSSVVRSNGALRCSGTLRSASGSQFTFTDTYTPAGSRDAFLLARDVSVQVPSPDDLGFLTRFSLKAASPVPLCEHEFFIPGIWYLDNKYVPPGALAANLSEEYFIIREDRMPLPLVMMRDKSNGVTITLIHANPSGSTCLADYTENCVVDQCIQVASLGVFSQTNAAIAFCYPATEGQRSYSPKGGWVQRFHPVQPGVRHSYQVLIELSEQPDFPKAMRRAWRTAFELLHPPPAKTSIEASYEASISLVADWSRTCNGCPGIPFRLSLPRGQLMDTFDINYQMGFVGQQLPLAYHLVRYGLLKHDDQILKKGEAMVDFWATNSLTPEGLPRTWFDVYPQPHWRGYNTFMRVASDGMGGALMAWSVMQRYGHSKPEWLRFCRGFGDWLAGHQNPDGTWYREYDWAGRPVHRGKQSTSHPIRFLADLHKATGERRYLEAAMRAGDWCFTNIHQGFAYVGGTPDNPNVLDKEAGFMAMDAFLALHDLTGAERWLEAATQAADFTETWAYSWNIPLPEGDPAATYPKGCTSTAFSLIATGHSAADLFLAGAPFFYYRLYLETGERHYADIARQLLYDTKQAMDIGGSLGYGHPGLCTEALGLVPPRGHGVNVWLPWLSYSMLEPVVRLQEAYGSMDAPIVEGNQLEALRAKDREYGRTRGIFIGESKAR